MGPEEIRRYLEGLEKGRPVCAALLKIDDPIVLMQVIAASIDTWCATHENDPCEIIDAISIAMHEVNSLDIEDD